MVYVPGHDFVVYWVADPGAVVESTNPAVPATLPAITGDPVLLGHTNPPSITRDEGNAKGYSIGARGAAYNKKGTRKYQMTIELRWVNLAFLAKCLAADPVALYWGVTNEGGNNYLNVWRGARCSQITMNFSEGDAQEITASAAFEAIAEQPGTAVTTLDASLVRGLGPTMLWSNVVEFSIGGADYREVVSGLSLTINHNLERKNQRFDWGDNQPLSRTSYGLLAHHFNGSGQLNMHDKISDDLFTGATNSQISWGNIVMRLADSPRPAARDYTFTIGGALPTRREQQGVESSAQLTHSIPFEFDTVTLADTV